MSTYLKCKDIVHRLFNGEITREELDQEVEKVTGKQGHLNLKVTDKKEG